MNQILLHPYELKVRDKDEVRRGYLLKISLDSGASGYADIFPWPQFGDPSFGEIPQLIKKEVKAPLLLRSLELARQDAEARIANTSLTSGVSLTNHYLLPSLSDSSEVDWQQVLSDGFKRIKIKLKELGDTEVKHLSDLAQRLPQEVMFRLDLNGRGSIAMLDRLVEFKEKIEFIEDPSNGIDLWDYPLPMAFDQATIDPQKVSAPWLIVKPAKQHSPQSAGTKVVFTSYMDHPVGIAHAFAEAKNYGPQQHDYGLLSQTVYEPTEFHSLLLVDGPRLSFAKDKGIGFTHELESLSWESVF